MSPLKPLRVLVVEDEALIAMDIEDSIEDAGHVVAGWATNSDEAISMIAETKPDLVLLDIRLLNGTSGIDVARYIAEAATEGPNFIFLTANAEELPADLAGAIGVLPKPFTMDRLTTTLGFLQKGIFDPPPSEKAPYGLTLAPSYRLIWG